MLHSGLLSFDGFVSLRFFEEVKQRSSPKVVMKNGGGESHSTI